MKIKIENEIHEILDVHNLGYLPMVKTDHGEYYLAEDINHAGEAAREYWEDLAQNDPGEFACIVGEETLVQWGLGRSAGPGYNKVNSLEDWLDLHLDCPEETFGSYDGAALEVNRSGKVQEDIGFSPTIAFRCN